MDERQHSLHLSMVTCCVAVFITATATHHWIGGRRATLIMRRAAHHWIDRRRATLIMRRAVHHWIDRRGAMHHWIGGSRRAAAIRTAHQRLDTGHELVFALLAVGWWRIRGATLWIQSLADVAIRKLGLTLMDERQHSLHLSMVTCCVAVFITATATHHWISGRRATLIMRRASHHWIDHRRAVRHWISGRRAAAEAMIVGCRVVISDVRRRLVQMTVGNITGVVSGQTSLFLRLDTALELEFARLAAGRWRIR